MGAIQDKKPRPQPGESKKDFQKRYYEWRWTKGKRPYPGGTKAYQSLARIMKAQMGEPAIYCPPIADLAEELGIDPRRTPIGAVIAMAALVKAANNPAYFISILERLEGKVSQTFKGEFAFDPKALHAILANRPNDVQKLAIGE